MSSGGSGSGSHGGGWVSWLVFCLLVAYAVAVVWAANAGLSAWVFIFGTLGAAGFGWFAYHMGHVIGHALHSPVANMIVVALGAWAVYTMVMPVVEWRSVLSVPELWCDMTLGSVGIFFLAYEIGHILHHHRVWQTVIGLAAIALVVGLYIGRPAGAAIAPVPPLAKKPVPTHSVPAPGFGRPSGGGGGSATKSSGGKLDCAKLSPRAAQAAGCKR